MALRPRSPGMFCVLVTAALAGWPAVAADPPAAPPVVRVVILQPVGGGKPPAALDLGSGVPVARRWVMMTAHQAAGMPHAVETGTAVCRLPGGTDVKVTQLAVHPYADVALARVDGDLPDPLPLSPARDVVGKTLECAGFLRKEQGDPERIEYRLKVVEAEDNKQVGDMLFCDLVGRKALGQGTSGGPACARRADGWDLAGVLSGAQPRPGGAMRYRLARAASLADWVEFVTAPDYRPRESPLVWGEAKEGLALGIRYANGDRPYVLGEGVPCHLYLRNTGKEPVEVTVSRSGVGWSLAGPVRATDAAGRAVVVRGPNELPDHDFLASDATVRPDGRLFVAPPQFRTLAKWSWAAGDPLDPAVIVGPGDYKVTVTWPVRLKAGGKVTEVTLTSGELPLRVAATRADALKAMRDRAEAK